VTVAFAMVGLVIRAIALVRKGWVMSFTLPFAVKHRLNAAPLSTSGDSPAGRTPGALKNARRSNDPPMPTELSAAV
jgi:hypothetical protein